MRGPAALAEHWDLALAWLAYGLIHSLLAGDWLKRAASARLSLAGPPYRLAFNLIALLLLLPIAGMILADPGTLLWDRPPGLSLAFDLLALGSVLALLLAGPGYDLGEFVGLPGRAAARPALRVSGWHCYVRHPWYSVALLLVWTREPYAAWLISAVCISVYLVIGARLEEAKLERSFGEAYRRYRARVPGLLPYRGRALSAAEAGEIEAAAVAALPPKAS